MNSSTLQALAKKERKKQQKKTELLKIAKEVFAEKGLALTCIEDIALKADASVGSFYNFFKNKNDLYMQTIQDIFQEFEKYFDRLLLKQTDLKTAIRNIIALRIEFFFKYRSFSLAAMQAVFEGMFSKDKKLKELCLQFRQTYLQKILSLFQTYQKELGKIDFWYLSLTLDGAIGNCIFYLAHNKTSKSKKQITNELACHFFCLLGLENM